MNAGLSIELLLKAIIVENENGEFKCIPKTHDLCKLADKAKLSQPQNSKVKKVLKTLTKYIVWRGKYPVPITEKQYEDSKGDSPIRFQDYDDIWNSFQQIYWKVKSP